MCLCGRESPRCSHFKRLKQPLFVCEGRGVVQTLGSWTRRYQFKQLSKKTTVPLSSQLIGISKLDYMRQGVHAESAPVPY